MTCQAKFLRWPASSLVLLVTLLSGQSVVAQTPPTASAEHCPAPESITPSHLFGLWQLTLGTPERPGGEGQLSFERHPEYPGSVRGTLTRRAQDNAFKALVAGDVTDQGFQLEESADGVNIDAVWSGDVLPDSCAREIRGWRRVVEGNTTQEALTEQPFVLQKTPGWR